MPKKKEPSSGPSNAYLVSFGDTMTTLLAFFIVLNSLATEQTGANLYEGTGSFVRALNNFGMPGNLPGDRKKTAVPRPQSSPHYVVPNESHAKPDRDPLGPDEDPDDGRVIDRELEDFERFVDELKKLSEMTQWPAVRGEAVFDYFDKLQPAPPMLNAAYRRALGQVLPLLYDERHRVEVVVWATSPAPSALERAARQSHQLALEMAELGKLDEAQRARLTTTSRIWMDSDAKRPVISIITRKLGNRSETTAARESSASDRCHREPHRAAHAVSSAGYAPCPGDFAAAADELASTWTLSRLASSACTDS